jgi:3-phenylpropionate/trans-cinnamate dioxygenase ferredoxin reductase subunit
MNQPRPGTARRIVIVGAGLGGLRVLEGLRAAGFRGPITMVGAERHAPYDRPPLTKQVLRGELTATALCADYADLDVDLRLGRRVVALDSDRHRMTLDDATELDYDVAVLAPGAQPRVPPGMSPRPGLHLMRTIEDALALHAALATGASLAVVGGGFIGCEVASSARGLGCAVTLIEALPAPLIRSLGAQAAAQIQALMLEHGVEVITGVGVSELLGTDHVEGLVLADGRRIAATEVVLGLGVTPDIGWLDGSGLKIEDGIVCDAVGRTTQPDVYALGDAARWWHPLAGEYRRIEHWTNTVEQAAVVAAAIGSAAEPAAHDSVPYFWSDQFGLKIQALGFLGTADDIRTLTVGAKTVVLYGRDGVLVGVLGFSAARSVMRMRPLIAGRATIGEAQALLST